MTYPGSPPPIDPRVLRPRRVWYVVAAVVAVLGLAAAPILLALGVNAASMLSGSLPTLSTQFDAATPVSVDLSADKTWAIYAETASDDAAVSAQCTATPAAGGTIDLTRPTSSVNLALDGRNWSRLYVVRVSQNGQYRIECTSSGAAGTGRYAIGEDTDVGGLIGSIFGVTGALFGALLLPCGGLLIGGIIALVTGLRRSSYRKRLEQQHMGPRPWG